MKTLYLFCLSVLVSLSSFAQYVITAEEDLKLENNFREEWHRKQRQRASGAAHNKAGVCDTDTLMYSQYKSSTTRFINLNTTNSAHGFGQYFPVGDTMVLHGFHVYAYDQTFFGVDTAVGKLYFANAEGLPTGAPVETVGMTVPWNSSSPLSNIRLTVMFPNPRTVFYDFVAAFESPTTDGIVVATNNWDLGDGDMKGFACVKFATGWAKGTNVTVGSTTPPTVFDADIYIEPIVSYKIKSNFRPADESCLGSGEPFKFKNESTPLLDEAFNPLVIDAKNDDSFEWDYGDGSAPDSVVDGENNYLSTSITSYSVSLKSTFSGWTMANSCTDTYTGIIRKPNLDAKFSTSINLGVVTCTDQSVDANRWWWDFGDGSVDSVQSPIHTYNAAGLYKVKQYAYSGGCVDSAISTVQIVSTGINELKDLGIRVYPNPVHDQLTLELPQSYQAAGQLNVVLYSFTGSQVMSYQTTGNRGSMLKMDIASLGKGNYLLKLSTANGTVLGRAIVVKE